MYATYILTYNTATMEKKKTKKKDWNSLPKEERKRLIDLADSLFIPPQFVSSMYESGQIQ